MTGTGRRASFKRLRRRDSGIRPFFCPAHLRRFIEQPGDVLHGGIWIAFGFFLGTSLANMLWSVSQRVLRRGKCLVANQISTAFISTPFFGWRERMQLPS